MRRDLIAGAIALCLLAAGVFAQVRPVIPTSERKTNQRSSEHTPSPTPPVVSPTPSDDEVIRVTTQLVSVPVRVMDKRGRFIGGLAKENFRVFEDGVEQRIEHFSNENEPFTVALVLDMSYSTNFKIGDIQSAAMAFVDQLRPQDKVMVVSFDQEVHLLCEPTNNRRELFAAIKQTKISTGTSLYEAVDLVINERFRLIDGRKAMILFTDGVDTTSRRIRERDNLDIALELDALIFPIRYDTFEDVQKMQNELPSIVPPPIPIALPSPDPKAVRLPPKRPTPVTGSPGTTEAEYQKAHDYLDALAVRTGGRVYPALTLASLADAYTRIASELREFYSLSYYPSAPRVEQRPANIKVKVDREGVSVRARETYLRRKDAK